MKLTHSIPSPLPFVENRTLQPISSSRVFNPIGDYGIAFKQKREFAYQTFIETIAGNHSECKLKAVMDLSITACLRLRRRKTTGFLRYPAILFQ